MKLRNFLLIFMALVPIWANGANEGEVKNNDKNPQLLLSRDSLPYKDGNLLVLQGLGLFMQNDNEFVSLDHQRCTGFKRFRLKKRYRCDNLFLYNAEMVIQSGNCLVHLDGDSTNVILQLEDDNFVAFPAKDGLFSLVTEQINDKPVSANDSVAYVWSLYSTSTGKLNVQMGVPEPIINVICVSADDYFVVTGTDILRCNSNGTFIVARAETPILSAAITDTDLYFSTTDAVYRVDTDGRSYPIVNGNLHSMFIDGNRMYLVMKVGDVYFMDL